MANIRNVPIKEPSKKELLQVEIEERMHELVCSFLSESEITKELVLSYMRASYIAGYADCYKEPKETLGECFKKLGYTL